MKPDSPQTTSAGITQFSQPDKHSGDHRVFLFQINVTRDCNLRCAHCYIASEVKALSHRLSVSQFLKIVGDIGDYMKNEASCTHAEIHVVGGEPTMLGKAFYDTVMPQAHALLEAHGDAFTWEFILVTNLLSREILDIAPWFNKISTAYEPETRFPKPFHEKWWLDNVHALQAAGLDISITTCMTRPVIEYGARRLCDRLHQDLGIQQIHFGFYIESGDGRKNSDRVTPGFKQTSDFLIESAEWYFERRDAYPDLYVNPAESMLSAIERGSALDDIVCPIISGSLDIDSTGQAMTCLQEGGELDAKWEGNVLTSSVAEVIKSEPFMRRRINATRPHRACMTCDEYKVCRSGCGVNFKNWDPERDEDCPGYKGFIKHIRKRHSEGLLPRHSEYRSRVAF